MRMKKLSIMVALLGMLFIGGSAVAASEDVGILSDRQTGTVK